MAVINLKILIIGGDRRMAVALKELSENGFEVDSLGLMPNDNGNIYEADVLLLPVPTTRDGENVFCPLSDKKIPLEYLKSVKKDTLVLTCGYKIPDCNCIDYLALDEFAVLNAVPTAEGAIAKAITDTDFCLWKSRVLIIGYGRIGKILADRLRNFKCDLTVSARKKSDFAMLDALSIKHIHTNEAAKLSNSYDVIFNTIDVTVFKDNLKELKRPYIYDLSSKGCIDIEAAAKSGVKAVKLPGIPGKTAYITAGKIIAQTVIDSVKEVM